MTTTKWTLDPTHSELSFKIRHLMISNVSGGFTKFNVSAESIGNDFETAKISADIEVSSINTNNTQRDEHLRNADFFEIEKHPSITFRSTKVARANGDVFDLYGDLTIKNITHPVKLAVEYSGLAKDSWGNIKAGFTINGRINRKNWGITYNAALETGGFALGDEVKIVAEVQLVKEAIAEAVA
jgi:polyisoprenoid-binding protein YceI